MSAAPLDLHKTYWLYANADGTVSAVADPKDIPPGAQAAQYAFTGTHGRPA